MESCSRSGLTMPNRGTISAAVCVAAVQFADGRSGTANGAGKPGGFLRVTVAFPFGRGARRSHADVARAEESCFATSAFDLSHHLGGMGDVVDDECIIQRRENVERRFLKDGLREAQRQPTTRRGWSSSFSGCIARPCVSATGKRRRPGASSGPPALVAGFLDASTGL